jgi:hypothetical protein
MLLRVTLSTAMLLLTGCAGLLGPPFGPGPEADSVLGILLILLCGGLLYPLAKGWQNPKHAEPPGIHIVRERYARGELTREEYQDMIRDLSAPANRI